MVARICLSTLLMALVIVVSGCGDDPASSTSGLEDIEELVACWSFDDGSGSTAADVSRNNLDATIHGAAWASGALGGALAFDGVDDYVEVVLDSATADTEYPGSLGEGSISVWFSFNHVPVDEGMIPILHYGAVDVCPHSMGDANQGLVIEVGHSPIHMGSKRLYFTIFANGCGMPSFCYDSLEPLNEDTWYHFVAIVGPDYNTGYLNGEEMVERNYNFGDTTYSQFFADAVAHEVLWIGKCYWNGTPVFFDGLVDEIRIYGKPLSAEEVAELYSDR